MEKCNLHVHVTKNGKPVGEAFSDSVFDMKSPAGSDVRVFYFPRVDLDRKSALLHVQGLPLTSLFNESLLMVYSDEAYGFGEPWETSDKPLWTLKTSIGPVLYMHGKSRVAYVQAKVTSVFLFKPLTEPYSPSDFLPQLPKMYVQASSIL
jgi:hypothetical protein